MRRFINTKITLQGSFQIRREKGEVNGSFFDRAGGKEASVDTPGVAFALFLPMMSRILGKRKKRFILLVDQLILRTRLFELALSFEYLLLICAISIDLPEVSTGIICKERIRLISEKIR
jgi:hypothetical protein